MNSITKRWVRGSLLVTILMCLVAEAVFLYYSITNYYDGARRAMTTRTSTIITQLNASAAQTARARACFCAVWWSNLRRRTSSS